MPIHCNKGYAFKIAGCGCGCIVETVLPAGHDPIACKKDSDCVLSCRQIDRCCGRLCTCNIPYNKRTAAILTGWYAKRCKKTICPMPGCMPDRTVRRAVCHTNQCAVLEGQIKRYIHPTEPHTTKP